MKEGTIIGRSPAGVTWIDYSGDKVTQRRMRSLLSRMWDRWMTQKGRAGR